MSESCLCPYLQFLASPRGGETAVPFADARKLQDSQFPKFGVYRVFVDGVRRLNVTVFPGVSTLTVAEGLDESSAHNITLWYSTGQLSHHQLEA